MSSESTTDYDKENPSCVKQLSDYLLYVWQFRSIYKMLVETDFKGRFKYTALGYFWHLLTPLTQIIIYFLVFTVIFGRDIPNYWVYISTGMFAFSFFMSSTAGASKCIIEKKSLITKMSMAREVIVLSRVTTNLITLTISYLILIVLMIITGVTLTINILYLPLIVFGLAVFNLGLAFFLSAIVVYIRDVANAASLLFGCMMFAIPVIYLAETRSTPAMEFMWSINPLYYYVETIHDVFYLGISPDLFQVSMCLIFAVISLIIGLWIFKKLERGFVERL